MYFYFLFNNHFPDVKCMTKITRFILVAGIVACQVMPPGLSAQDMKWSPEHVYYGSGGKLVYTPDAQGNTIPDFSHVGYMYGDEAIPDVPTVVEVHPVDGDDGATIQAAVNQVASMNPDSNGFRGAVLLKRGTYQVSGQIFIQASGIVLRGEGMTDEGTVVIAAGTGKRDFIVIGKGRGRSGLNSKVNIVEDYVPVGRKFVVVDDASGYRAGDHIALYRPGTANWISDLKMDQIPDSDGSTKQWKPSSYSFYFERLVTKVSGDSIFFRNPVIMAMETKYGGGNVFKCSSDRINRVGVENICLKSTYQFEGDEAHAWTAIAFNSIEHGWARNITSWYFGFACVSLQGSSRLISVEDCHCREPVSIITGGRRYSFQNSGSLNLVRGCSTTEGRHDYATGSRVCGPNVFTNCTASNTHADIGPHHRWAMGSLFELIVTDGSINVQDRGASGTGHGWAGANQVFWNCTGASSICQNPYVSAKNYNFGFIGKKNPGWNQRPDGVWVGHDKPGIFPESLYMAQWQERVNNVQLFSVFSSLEKVNDTAFILNFNLPVKETLVNPNNFSVTGDAGYEGAEFSVDVLSDTSVMLQFDGIGPLPAFSSVVVNVDHMISDSGQPLEGLTSATYIEPDLRPVVTGLWDQVNNEDGILEASSSKPGTIYLIWFNGDYNYLDAYQQVDDLDSAVWINQGRKQDAPLADTPVTISTRGLPGGYYFYLAVDEEGRISAPADEWPQVEQTGSLLRMNEVSLMPGFTVWSSHGAIFVRSDDHSATYSARIFDMTGRIIHSSENMMGEQQLMLPEYPGILLVQLISECGLHIGTYTLLNDS